jgi:lipopolysaccharide biosynthesis regulator YciM
MTDKKDDLDWETALEEWDEKAFSPEVARDQVTKKPATLTGPSVERHAARPLYRPPTGPVVPNVPRPVAKPAAPPRPAPLLKKPPPPIASLPKPRIEEDEDSEAHTMVANLAPASPMAMGGHLAIPTPEPVGGNLGVPTPDPSSKPEPTPEPEPTPDPRPRPEGGLERDASDDDVDALLGGADPVPLPRPGAITRDFSDPEAPTRPPLTSSIEVQISEVELVEPSTAPKAPLVPEDRKHDPDAETRVGTLGAAARQRAKEVASRPPVEFDDVPLNDTAPAPVASPLDEAKLGSLRARAGWLEAEAGLRTGVERARILLTLSEIEAVLGERERAATLAASARDAAPELLLAHKQARALAEAPSRAELAEMLQSEGSAAEAPVARLHALLLAADALRSNGDEDGAVRTWSDLILVADGDPRPAVAIASYLLAHDELKALAALADKPGAAAIKDGILAALALRGFGDEALPATEAFANVRANDALRRARAALRVGDVPTASNSLSELREVPELARGAGWLYAALGTTQPETARAAADALQRLVAVGEASARRALAARAIELGDTKLAEAAIDEPPPGTSFSTADRAVLRTLLNIDPDAREGDAEALLIAGSMAPLASAVAALSPARSPSAGDDDVAQLGWLQGRAERVAGLERSRAEVRVARLLSANAPRDVLAAAIGSAEEPVVPEAAVIAIELEARHGAWQRVSGALLGWAPSPEHGHPGDGALAAGLVAERAGEDGRARQAYQQARAEDPKNEGVARALVALDPTKDLPDELSGLADELGESVTGALARLEAVMRAEGVDDATKTELLERAHRAAPALPMASFLARRIARKARDSAELLRWMEEARTSNADPSERALDAVRQAHLLLQTEPLAAAACAEEAHKARPDDIALRELYERLSPEPPEDQGAWREERARKAVGDARAIFYMEAAHKYEARGDKASALRAAEAAVASGDSVLARLARERAELDAGAAARLADELLVKARETESPEERREAYVRLADLDAVGRGDPASALLWHRSILEEAPDHKPSLRYLEHALISEGRDEELEPIATGIARALDGREGGECVAHADFAARLRARGAAGSWEATRDVAELGARQPVPSLSSQRLLNAHGRSKRDDALILATTLALLERTTRPSELAVQHLRAGEAASRLGDLGAATDQLERAKGEDPGDVVLWGLLADVRQKAGDPRGAAEACEALARTSTVAAHQLPAWYDAAKFWLDDIHDEDRGLIALEQASAIDLTFEDVFPRLLGLYTSRGKKNELAALLERRIATITDPEERVAMEVERGRALAEVGDTAGARQALAAALEAQPDSTAALSRFADLSAREQDWEAAEQAWVRLARLLTSPEEQREVYARLGQLYSINSVNLSRAELAFKEVLKRAPGDVATLEHLVDVYRRQNDAPHAIDIVQQLAAEARDPAGKRARLIELASIHESPGHDTRKAEQVLEGARREFPTDVAVLRALAEFYIRHKQMPAVHILLDRAAADARRAFAAGRFAPELFEIMRAVFELRGRKDASRIVAATLAAFDGQPAVVRGAEARALDPKLDDYLAPEVLTPALRSLLKHTGVALDAAVPVDLRSLQATPLGPAGASIQNLANALAAAAGLGAPNIYVSAPLGRACLPASSDPPTLVVGEGLLSIQDNWARGFMIVRAVKLIATHASALVRTPSGDLGVLISAWLQAFNPNWTPQGVNPTALAAASRKIATVFPKKLPPDLGMLALEVAGSLGMRASTLGGAALAWANRAALLAIGDPNAALQAIAWSHGAKDGAPVEPQERAAWLARTHEAKDLLTFSIGDGYAEAREKLGLDK